MNVYTNTAKQDKPLPYQEVAVRNEQFVRKCLKVINAAPDPEEGLSSLLEFLGTTLECDRVYVFEDMDRQHISNTCEWCKEGVPSGINLLPYIPKKDLLPWYDRLNRGENIIEPEVDRLQKTDPLIYDVLKAQQITSIVLSPMLAHGKMCGLLGADNPPPEKLTHISVLFDVLAYFVSSLLSERELSKLRRLKVPVQLQLQNTDKTVLLVDDSAELLKCNERVLRHMGYRILSARSLQGARDVLKDASVRVIVMDIDLPDGNGIEFYKELGGNIPVIFLTARSDQETVREGLRVRKSRFLTKPYRLEDLQNAVEQAIKN